MYDAGNWKSNSANSFVQFLEDSTDGKEEEKEEKEGGTETVVPITQPFAFPGAERERGRG